MTDIDTHDVHRDLKRITDAALTAYWQEYARDGGVITAPDGTGAPRDQDVAAAMDVVIARAQHDNALTWRLALLDQVYRVFAESDPVRLEKELTTLVTTAVAWSVDIRRRQALGGAA